MLIHSQYSTQWDSFSHIGALFDADGDGAPEHVYYNGFKVVSEETGHIAIAFNGRLTRHLDSGGLHALLLEQLSKQQEEESEQAEELSRAEGEEAHER